MPTLSLDENIYFLLILGMVAVGAHAYTLFNQKLPVDDTSPRWRFLNNVPIQLVTSRQKFNLGFLAYLILFEFIYLVLASSSSLVVMLYQLSGREELTGALSASVRPSGAIPILASTAIILFSQIQPFARTEQWFRASTHRLANIPEGLRSVKQRIASQLNNPNNWQEDNVYKRGKERSEPKPDDESVPGSDTPTISPGVEYVEHDAFTFATVTRWACSFVDLQPARHFARSYCNVILLSSYTLEATGATVWDAAECEEILQIFQPTESEIANLRHDIDNAIEQSIGKGNPPTAGGQDPIAKDDANAADNDVPGEKPVAVSADTRNAVAIPFTALIKQTFQLEERLIMLFSLLAINQPDVRVVDERRFSDLLTAAHRREPSYIVNMTLRAAVIGGAIALMSIFFYFTLEAKVRSTIRAEPHVDMAPYGEYVDKRISMNLDSASRDWRLGYEEIEREDFAVKVSMALSQISSLFQTSIQELIRILLLFIPAVLVVLTLRDKDVRAKQWSSEHLLFKETLPISKYYSACGYGSLASLSLMFVYYFLILALVPAYNHDKDVLSLDIIQPFLSFMPSLVLTGLIAFVCGYYALYLCDLFTYEAGRLQQASEATGRSRGATNQDEQPVSQSSSPFKVVALVLYFSTVCSALNLASLFYLGAGNSWWDIAQGVVITWLGFFAVFLSFSSSARKYQQQLGNILPNPHLPGGEGREATLQIEDHGHIGDTTPGNHSGKPRNLAEKKLASQLHELNPV